MLLAQPELAGIHFTGSTDVFRYLWRTVGANIEKYRGYPRIVGETGEGLRRRAPERRPGRARDGARSSAFGTRGRSARPRAAPTCGEPLAPPPRADPRDLAEIRMGDLAISPARERGDRRERLQEHPLLHRLREELPDATILAAEALTTPRATSWSHGRPDDEPRFRLMEEEIFGPVLTLYVSGHPLARDARARRWDEPLRAHGPSSPARKAIEEARAPSCTPRGTSTSTTSRRSRRRPAALRRLPRIGHERQGRKPLNLLRWVSPRTVKENSSREGLPLPFMALDAPPKRFNIPR